MVRLKRAYESVAPTDGHRVLVERLWPRGLRKERAHFDEWLKDIAPSDSLRKWFHQDPSRWAEFQQRYLHDLDTEAAQALLDGLVRRATAGTITLVYSAHDEMHNSAIVLKKKIERRLGRSGRSAKRPAKRGVGDRSVEHSRH